ncbi:MAG: hypothetical protein QOF94_1006 [Acidobacteriaceae bacterium]
MRNFFEKSGTMTAGVDVRSLFRSGMIFMACCFASSNLGWAMPGSHSPCRMHPTMFEGWKAEELINDWVRLTFVPQLGGRLMQVEFGGHHYLFVNPKYKGRYFAPVDAGKQREWINYGGDKLWPLPEGHGEGYWPGPVSDVLDDGEYKLAIVSPSNPCTIRLEGPADPATGLQYSREISLGSDSPQISFHAVMKNASERSIRWSIQSVTQYDTGDSRNRRDYNQDFWAFTPVNRQSAYGDGYRVRNGLADDPSYSVHDGVFTLRWLYLENEVWLDSDAGWLAVIDESTKFGIVERFLYLADQEYPGKASVIFYKNGAALELDNHGVPTLRSNHPEEAPYYMEAEINSPMRRLDPGASYALDTAWFPVRAGKGLKSVTQAGVVERPLAAFLQTDHLTLSGCFGVFFAGKLKAHVFDLHGAESNVVDLEFVDPLREVELNQTITVSPGATRVAIHLSDEQGVDRGSLGEAEITKPGKDS